MGRKQIRGGGEMLVAPTDEQLAEILAEQNLTRCEWDFVSDKPHEGVCVAKMRSVVLLFCYMGVLGCLVMVPIEFLDKGHFVQCFFSWIALFSVVIACNVFFPWKRWALARRRAKERDRIAIDETYRLRFLINAVDNRFATEIRVETLDRLRRQAETAVNVRTEISTIAKSLAPMTAELAESVEKKAFDHVVEKSEQDMLGREADAKEASERLAAFGRTFGCRIVLLGSRLNVVVETTKLVSLIPDAHQSVVAARNEIERDLNELVADVNSFLQMFENGTGGACLRLPFDSLPLRPVELKET